MNVRAATRSDRPAIRDVARRSLQASYSLGPQAITSAIEEWYDEDRLADAFADDRHQFLVAEVEDQVVGFSESEITAEDVAMLLWLHVDPAYRGREIGSTLFETTRDHLERQGAGRLHGRVLADNADGNAFYTEKGFVKSAEASVDIDGRTYRENVYVEGGARGREPIDAEDGRTVFVDFDLSDRGSAAAFHPVFSSADGDERYGFYCGNCDSLANAMDAMGRIECDNCGNARKPTRWDAAYL